MWTKAGSMQGAAALALAGCSVSSAPEAAAAEPPFTITEVADFDSPWALDFLPGSGVPTTNMALLSERGGRLWLVDAATGKKTEVGGVPQARIGYRGFSVAALTVPQVFLHIEPGSKQEPERCVRQPIWHRC